MIVEHQRKIITMITETMNLCLSEMSRAILQEIASVHCRKDIIEHHQVVARKFLDFTKTQTSPYSPEQLRDLIKSAEEICVFDGWPAMKLKQTKFIVFCERLLTV